MLLIQHPKPDGTPRRELSKDIAVQMYRPRVFGVDASFERQPRALIEP